MRLVTGSAGVADVLQAAASGEPMEYAPAGHPLSAHPLEGAEVVLRRPPPSSEDVDRLLDRLTDRLEFEVMRAYGDGSGA